MCSRRVGDKRKICFGPNWAYHKITYDLIGSFKKKKDLHGPFQQIMKNPTAYDLFSMLMWWIHVKTCVSGVWQVHPRKKWSGLTPLRESIMKFRGRGGRILQDFSEPLEGKKQQQPGRSLRSYILPWKLPIESNHETYREPITIFQVRVVK